jgi:hypothetical protein
VPVHFDAEGRLGVADAGEFRTSRSNSTIAHVVARILRLAATIPVDKNTGLIESHILSKGVSMFSFLKSVVGRGSHSTKRTGRRSATHGDRLRVESLENRELLDASQFFINLGDTILEGAANAAAGFGDTISVGITRSLRQNFDIDGAVDKSSACYVTGQIAGVAHAVVTAGACGTGLLAAEAAPALTQLWYTGGVTLGVVQTGARAAEAVSTHTTP